MTPMEMETLLHDIDLRLTRVDLRLTRVEQALPAMAVDLRGAIADSARGLRREIAETATTLSSEMAASTRMLTDRVDGLTDRVDGLSGRIDGLTDGLGQTERSLRVLIEDLRGDNQVLAEHILTLLSRFPPQ